MFFIDPNQFAAASQSHVDKVSALANNILSNVEQMTSLNIRATRSALELGVASNRLFLENEDLNDPMTLQAELIQPFNSWFLNYVRSTYEIGTQNRQDVTSAFEDQVVELNKSIARSLEQTRIGGAGSETTISALKAAVAALNSAYENMSAAGKQAVNLIDANAAAVTDSIVEAGIAKLEHHDVSGEVAQTARKARSRKSQNEAA